MIKILTWIKDNKRIFFCILAILTVVANQFGFVEYQLDENIAIVVMAVVTLVLSVIRKKWNL